MRAHRLLASCCIGALIAQPFLSTAGAQEWFASETSVQKLAKQIDKLEQHLDCYGTVVPKSPDVWGQARLTKYREEYERQMADQLGGFAVTLNAAISRSDQAFLASTLALQAAISGRPAGYEQPSTKTVESSVSVPVINPDGTQLRDPLGNPVIGKKTDQSLAPTTEFQQIDIPPAAKAADFPAPAFNPTFTVREKEIVGFTNQDVALEPTLKLDQMSRYINHLHELRRINDGDDKADAPGYGLHLVRIPVSVLPGKRTCEGYGAEITVTAKPHLHEQLLPITFKGLVINDLVDHFAFPLAKFLDSQEGQDLLKIVELDLKLRAVLTPAARTTLQYIRDQIAFVNGQIQLPRTGDRTGRIKTSLSTIDTLLESLVAQLPPSGEGRDYLLEGVQEVGESIAKIRESLPLESDSVEAATKKWAAVQSQMFDGRNRAFRYQAGEAPSNGKPEAGAPLPEVADIKMPMLAAPSISMTPSRRSTEPFPVTQGVPVYGGIELGRIALAVQPLKRDPLHERSILLIDMQRALAEEFNAAYEYLKHNGGLWDHCTQALATAVRRNDTSCLRTLRRSFMSDLRHSDAASPTNDPELASNHIEAMAWAIIVESALLNERLVQDMVEIAAAKNNYCVNTQWLPYFHPCPCPEAVASFNAYVECRWPIHVVAVEPVTDDQNVADMFSQTRELQLALSMAFATGQIGAQSFTRMAQKLSLEMETIALNRTMVAFSHGDDTFGWRFYPRVQSPDTESPCKATMRMLFTGGPTRNYMLKNRRLEPGTRECTAVVIMPSFVPYVVFDTRCNWFKLTNPREKELDVRAGVNLSADITQLRCLTQACVADAHKYRNNETHRLTRAVDQLEQRLPLQTVFAQMPFENTLGGFEFFNSGVPDLAPELKGFYGEPGVLTGTGTATELFFVGDHFSVHETEVIVGNRKCVKTLLSRQVMRVSVPPDVNVVGDVVDAHVATPYGVSNHITIPVYQPNPVQTASATFPLDEFEWESTGPINVQVTLDGHQLPVSVCVQGVPTLKLNDLTPFGGPVSVDVAAKVSLVGSGSPIALDEPMMIPDQDFDRKTLEFPPKAGLCDSPFEAALLSCLQANHVMTLQSNPMLSLDTYVRVPKTSAAAGAKHVYHVKAPLLLNVNINCCQKAPCVSTARTERFDPNAMFSGLDAKKPAVPTRVSAKTTDAWEQPTYIAPPALLAPPR